MFDRNSRVVEEIDDNQNKTHHCYDDQNRLFRTVYANGTRRDLVWNRVPTVKQVIDGRNCVKSYQYDGRKLPFRMDVTGAPPGVGQTTLATWRWDGLGRLLDATDDDSSVSREWDSLGRPIAEEQAVDTGAGRLRFRTTCVFDGAGNKTQVTYPELVPGGSPVRTLTQVFDEVDRLQAVKDTDGTTLVAYDHIGTGARVLARTYRNGVKLARDYDADRRVIDHSHTLGAGTIRGFKYTWDRAGNRLTELDSRGAGAFFGYDSAYRLVVDNRNVTPPGALAGVGAVEGVVADPGAVGARTSYALDGANNRSSVTADGVTSAYSLFAGGALKNAEMNEYTTVGSTVLSYDLNGNQVSGAETGEQRFFDCDDQLVQATRGGSDVRYRYDPLGRRLSKYSATGAFTETVFVRQGWETLEERDGSGNLLKQYVYGASVDEPVLVNLPNVLGLVDPATPGPAPARIDLWYHDNSIGSVVALTTDWGQVAEQYRYKAYGELDSIQSLDRTTGLLVDVPETQVGNPFFFGAPDVRYTARATKSSARTTTNYMTALWPGGAVVGSSVDG